MEAATKRKPEKVALKCNECGKKFKVSPKAMDPRCPKCHGVDWDVDDPAFLAVALGVK